MTKYEPITFTKLSDAIAYLEDGGNLYQLYAGHAYSIDVRMLASGSWASTMLVTEKKASPWHEKLDGTIENGVLCRSDITGVVFLCVKFYADNFYDDQDNRMGIYITPLTRTEIQKFMDNAPEEV